MDAVEKAAEALRDGVNIRELINERYAEDIAQYVLDAIGYDALRAERDNYKGALERIRRDEGKVCGEYEICHHGSCQSSYSSWAIADEALQRFFNRKGA